MSAEVFLSMPEITSIVPVIGAADSDLYRACMEGISTAKLAPPVTGGASRTESVLAGLEALLETVPDLVLIHDAARPFVTPEIVRRVIDGLADADGAAAALPVVDALWQSGDDYATAPVDRTGLWRAQTPQGFHFDKILAAHRAAEAEAADDVEVARAANLSVRLVMGSERNFKITTPEDLARARREAATPG